MDRLVNNSSKRNEKSYFTLICIFWISVLVGTARGDLPVSASNIQRLRADLLKDYDKTLRPTVNHLAPTNVTMLFDVKHIIEMEEKLQILTVKGALMLKWNDDHLVWKPSDYGGVRAISLANDVIWKPDIVLLLSARKNDVSDSSSTVFVTSSGVVKWFPSVILDAPCMPRLRHYPFDEHNCTLKFGSWGHSGETIVLETPDLPLNSNEVKTTTEWRLQNVSNNNEIFKIGKYFRYYMVRVEIYLIRSSRIYRYVCVVPTVLTVLATLAAFWLQFAEPSRYMLGCSNIVMMALLLLHLASTIPAGDQMPILAEYSAACLCMSFIFLLITVAVTVVSRCSSTPPSAMVRFSRNVLNQGLCLSTFSQAANYTALDSSRLDNNMTSFDDRLTKTSDWLIVALVIDRISFWAFSLVYLVLLCVLASI